LTGYSRGKPGESGQQRQFGQLTVRDMALAGVRDVPLSFQVQDKMFAGELQVPAHRVDPDLRFNFPNKGYGVPKQQMKRYIDVHMARKAKLPSPDKYLGHT